MANTLRAVLHLAATEAARHLEKSRCTTLCNNCSKHKEWLEKETEGNRREKEKNRKKKEKNRKKGESYKKRRTDIEKKSDNYSRLLQHWS
jgi:uncharacterized protein YlxW (UPF0749 family)